MPRGWTAQLGGVGPCAFSARSQEWINVLPKPPRPMGTPPPHPHSSSSVLARSLIPVGKRPGRLPSRLEIQRTGPGGCLHPVRVRASGPASGEGGSRWYLTRALGLCRGAAWSQDHKRCGSLSGFGNLDGSCPREALGLGKSSRWGAGSHGGGAGARRPPLTAPIWDWPAY